MTSGRTGYSAGARRRGQILDAALALVLEIGHGALTVQKVAEKVGITEPAVFYHFRTKEHLLVSLLQHRDEHPIEADLRAQGLDDIDRIVVAVHNSQSTPNLVALFAEMASRAVDPGHPSHEYFTDRYSELQSALVRAGIARLPEQPAAVVNEYARILIATTDGLQRRWLVQRDIDMGESARVAAETLFGISSALDLALRGSSELPQQARRHAAPLGASA